MLWVWFCLSITVQIWVVCICVSISWMCLHGLSISFFCYSILFSPESWMVKWMIIALDMNCQMIYQVADIKKMNGLVSDLQMFARKTLHIPLPGRHPPSPILTNGFDTQGYCYDHFFPCSTSGLLYMFLFGT